MDRQTNAKISSVKNQNTAVLMLVLLSTFMSTRHLNERLAVSVTKSVSYITSIINGYRLYFHFPTENFGR